MMLDASRIAHAARGNDYLRLRKVVDGAGVLAGDSGLQAGKPDGIDSLLKELLRLIVKIIEHPFPENVRRFDGQRGVDVDFKVVMSIDHLVLLDVPDEIKHLLRAPHRKGRDHHVSAPVKGTLDHGCEGSRVIIVRRALMASVAIGGFHHDIIRFLRIGRIADQRLVLVPNIS